MKRIILCFVLLLASVFSFASAAETVSDIFSYIPYSSASWDSKTISESDGKTTTIEQTVMFKGKKMRMEGVLTDSSTGKKVNQVMIMTNKAMYIINKDEKSGTKFSTESAANPEKYREQSAKYRKNAKKTGSETINGIACDIYTYSYFFDGQESGDKINMTEWRAKDGFVVKSVSEWKDTKTTSTASNLKKNVTLADSLFEPAADIKIVDMDNMMKGIFTAPVEEKKPAGKVQPTPEAQAEEIDPEATVGSAVEDAVKDEVNDRTNNVIKGLFGQ